MHSLRDYYCGCLYVEEHELWTLLNSDSNVTTTKLWVFEHAPNQISMDQIAGGMSRLTTFSISM